MTVCTSLLGYRLRYLVGHCSRLFLDVNRVRRTCRVHLRCDWKTRWLLASVVVVVVHQIDNNIFAFLLYPHRLFVFPRCCGCSRPGCGLFLSVVIVVQQINTTTRLLSFFKLSSDSFCLGQRFCHLHFVIGQLLQWLSRIMFEGRLVAISDNVANNLSFDFPYPSGINLLVQVLGELTVYCAD